MPKKITNIKYVARARNAEHYHLQEQILAIITEAFATKFNITSVYNSYASAFQKEDEAYLQSVAYADTKQIETKNDERTGGLRYLQLGIQSKQFSPVANEKEAAESLLFMMKPYWNASLKPCQRSAHDGNFCHDYGFSQEVAVRRMVRKNYNAWTDGCCH